MSQKRRKFSPEEKLAILKRHLVGRENVSDICEELKIHPNQFYKWQGDLFSQGGSFFKKDGLRHKERREMKSLKNENAKLTRRIEKKDNVIAEITSEFVELKKKAVEIFGEDG